jgi:hypothetical protein
MGKAFGKWIDDNRTELIALSALSGAVSGAKIGRAGGVYGAVAGAVVVGGVSAFSTDAALDRAKKLSEMTTFEAELAKAKMALAKAQTQASKAIDLKMTTDKDNYKPGGEDWRAQMQLRSVAGAFRIANAAQQFGEKRNPVVEQLKEANDKLDVLGEIKNALAGIGVAR